MGDDETAASEVIVGGVGTALLALAPRSVRLKLRLDPRWASRLV
jgi:hypothetical protein